MSLRLNAGGMRLESPAYVNLDDLSEDVAREPDRDSLLRALRDLEAAEARVKRNAERIYDETRAQLVARLLPIIDNLERTIDAAEAAGCSPAVVDGARMVRTQLDGVLAQYGAERIEATGARFDPAIHEALTTIPITDPSRDRIVLEQLEPGYRFGDRVLRPAKVAVAMYRR